MDFETFGKFIISSLKIFCNIQNLDRVEITVSLVTQIFPSPGILEFRHVSHVHYTLGLRNNFLEGLFINSS